MVIGVPNVGKSSLINALRSKYLGKGMASLFSILNHLRKVSSMKIIFVLVVLINTFTYRNISHIILFVFILSHLSNEAT